MAGPWEDFQTPTAEQGPWMDFGGESSTDKKARLTAEKAAVAAEPVPGRFVESVSPYVESVANMPANAMNLLRYPLSKVGLAPEKPYQAGESMVPFLGDLPRYGSIPGLVSAVWPTSKAGKVSEGIVQSAGETAKGMTTPENVLALGAGMATAPESVAQKALTATYSGMMGGELVPSGIQAAQTVLDPQADLVEKAKAVTGVITAVGMTGSLGMHLKKLGIEKPTLSPEDIARLDPPSQRALLTEALIDLHDSMKGDSPEAIALHRILARPDVETPKGFTPVVGGEVERGGTLVPPVARGDVPRIVAPGGRFGGGTATGGKISFAAPAAAEAIPSARQAASPRTAAAMQVVENAKASGLVQAAAAAEKAIAEQPAATAAKTEVPDASKKPEATEMGVRSEGGEVGTSTPLRQQGQPAPEGKAQAQEAPVTPDLRVGTPSGEPSTAEGFPPSTVEAKAPTAGGEIPGPTKETPPISDEPTAPPIIRAWQSGNLEKAQRLADQLPEPSQAWNYRTSDANNLAGYGEGDAEFTRTLTVRGKPLWQWIEETRASAPLSPEAKKPSPAPAAETEAAPAGSKTEGKAKPPEVVAAEDASQAAFEKLGAAEKGAYDKSKRKGMTKAQLAKLAEFDRLVGAEKQAKAKAKQPPPAPSPVAPAEKPAETKAETGLISGTAAEKWADDVLKRGVHSVGPELVGAMVVKGAALIERGIRDFAAWSAEMIKQHGYWPESKLREIYEQAREYHANAVASRESVAVVNKPPNQKPAAIVTTGTPGQVATQTALAAPAQNFGQRAVVQLRSLMNQSLPRITGANREAGEAGVRMAAAHGVARRLGYKFADDILRGTDIDPVKFGVALSEDNLMDLRDQHLRNAKFLAEQGNEKAANKALKDAADVFTFIGNPDSPFKTIDELRAYLNQPDVKAAIEKHKQQWVEQKDPLFRQANDLKADMPLPTRGKLTGARVNLMALKEMQEAGVNPHELPTGVSSKLTRQLATLKRRDPFSKAATGTGKSYEGNYYEIMANGFEGEYPVAQQHEFIRKLVDSGIAKIVNQGEPKYLLKMRGWKGKFLEIDPRYAKEYEAATGLAPDFIPSETGKKVADFFTQQSVQGLAEGSTHSSNLLITILTSPGPTSKPLLNSLLKVTGRVDAPAMMAKAIAYGYANAWVPSAEAALRLAGITPPEWLSKLPQRLEAQELGLAKIGATKQPYTGMVSSRLLNPIDRGVRLTLGEVYKGMAKNGLVPDTETGLREFVNQAGNYNKRIQAQWIRALRTSGLQPFATATHTFNVLGVRKLALGPGAKANSLGAATMLRAEMAAGIIGVGVLTSVVNYLLNGNVTGPTGTPLGAIGWQGKDGKLHQLNVGRAFGYERGLRTTGVGGFIESKRAGLTTGDAISSGLYGVGGAAMSYAGGPGMRAAFTGLTGKRFSPPFAQEAPVAAPNAPIVESQAAQNMATAAIQANPILNSSVSYYQGYPLQDILTQQFRRYWPQTGAPIQTLEKLPMIVSKADANAFMEDVARRARRLPQERRSEYLAQEVEKMPDLPSRRKARALFRHVQAEP